MIVVDTDPIVYLTVGSGRLLEMAEAVVAKDSMWVAPPLWRSEFRNAMAGHLRAGLLGLEQAMTAFARAGDFLAAAVEPETSHLLELATSSRCSAYDLEFVVAAQSVGVPLVTLDRQVLDAFAGVASRPEDFVATP